MLRDGGQVVISGLLSQLRRLATEDREAELARLVADGSATLAERSAHFAILGLRARVEEVRERSKEVRGTQSTRESHNTCGALDNHVEARERVAAREPGGGS